MAEIFITIIRQPRMGHSHQRLIIINVANADALNPKLEKEKCSSSFHQDKEVVLPDKYVSFSILLLSNLEHNQEGGGVAINELLCQC